MHSKVVQTGFGFALGGITFVIASYVLHCGFGMGPWPCQQHPKCKCKAKTGERR